MATRITLLLAVVYFTVTSHAAIEFNNLIQSNTAQQNELARDIQGATQVASNVDESHVPAPTSDIANATAGNPNQVKADGVTVKEKDFSVTLKPTGRASALRYFPPKPPRAKKKAKSVARQYSATKTKAIASVGAAKKVKISKNKKLVKDSKNKKSAGLTRTQASVDKTK